MPPANDNFADATILTGNSGTVSGNNSTATGEVGEPDIDYHSVWFSWTCPSVYSGALVVDTIGSNFDTYLYVYTGSSLGSLSLETSDDDSGGSLTSKVTFTPTPDTTYKIKISGFSSGNFGDYILNYYTVAPPANDNFADATVLTGTSTNGDNSTATGEVGEPDRTYHSVWFKWTAPASVSSQIDTIGSDFDTYLYIYTGTTLTGLTLVAADDDSGGSSTSRIIFTPTAGVTYYIKITGYSNSSYGNYVLNYPEVAGSGASVSSSVSATFTASATVTGPITGALNSTASAELTSSGLNYVYDSKAAFEYLTSNTGVNLSSSKDSFEYITSNIGANLVSSKDSTEYITSNLIPTPTGFTCEKVPAPSTANSAYWEDNGNATLATTGAVLVTPGGYGQSGNIITKSTYSMGSFEFNLTMSAATGADGFSAGILYASQESSTVLGGAGGELGFNSPGLAGVAFLCSNWNSNITLSRRSTHNGSATTTTISGVTFSGASTYKIIAIYAGGTSYNFSMLKDGAEIFSPFSVSLPSINESVRFFVAGTTGGVNGTWTLGSASILESCGYKRGYGISRY